MKNPNSKYNKARDWFHAQVRANPEEWVSGAYLLGFIVGVVLV